MHSAAKAPRSLLRQRSLVPKQVCESLRPTYAVKQSSSVGLPAQAQRRGLFDDGRQPRSSRLALVRSFSCSMRAMAATGEQGATRSVDYLLADVGEGITECEIVKWFVEPGSMVEEFDVLVEVQSDKASVEITSRYAGRVAEHCYKVGEVAKVGSALCRIEVQDGGEAAKEEKAGRESGEAQASTSASTGGTDGRAERDNAVTTSSHLQSGGGKHSTLATPAVRRIVREHGLSIEQVDGTGKAGRVTKEDVQAFLASSPSAAASSSQLGSGEAAREEEKDIALTGTRKAMFKAMNTTWTVPHFGYSDEIDITKLDAMRREMQGFGSGTKLTLLPFLIKALSLALHNHPLFRSQLDGQALSLRQKEEHRISIALSTPRGLLTPTLAADVRRVSVLDVAEKVQWLQRTSNERNLTSTEIGSGATVTLSNIGSIGGLYTFPLIPPTGQLIIGAVGKSRVLPRFDARGDLVKALILPASFSADHRVVEGVELARFVEEWKQLLENPSSWLLRLR